MSRAVMCHIVAGYPDTTDCLKLLYGMQELGVAAVEIQIPFSDPIADGEAIMEANDIALESGMTTASSFALIEAARADGFIADIYLMSYIQKVQHFGLEAFCKRAAASQVKGLIIPDLPYDSSEFSLLRQTTLKTNIALIPVLSPGMSQHRLHALLKLKPSVVYLTSRRGITGNKYANSQELREVAATIKKQTDATLLIGFGISSAQDVTDALRLGDIAIVGSAIVRALQTSTITHTLEYIHSLLIDKRHIRRTKIV